MPKKPNAPKKPEKAEEAEKAAEAEDAEEIDEDEEAKEGDEAEGDEEPEIDLTDEERAIMMEVVKAGDKGVLADDIAKKLKMPVKKVEQILDRFEEEGWFYSQDEDN
jgi:hypothetical protein